MTDWTWRCTLPAERQSVPRARHEVSAELEARGLGALDDLLALATSELVTNAVLHAGGSVQVGLDVHDGVLRLVVEDGSGVLPRPRAYSEESSTGRGLLMVAVIAREWGSEPRSDGGKVVWADFDLPVDEPAACG